MGYGRRFEYGYLVHFNVYTGATGDRETGLGENVVLTLSELIKNRHHQLYFDNFFTSVSLLDKLLSQGMYACKNFPSEMSNEAKKFKRGEFVFRQCIDIDIVVTSCKDKKVVNVPPTPLQ